ncbi:E3 ubiquitin-protein ligase TRIM71-like [Ostrea edulis]|uniref:E3 ubiquitin-protein ligase TRIM71-like n=1 Tax=Ostrea edulis TaxID=37623 RepID=UPI0024AF0C95|nr:E3 ubiquitin-protein ligase TRIM71-like [Ostrea edulis]
MNNGTPHSMAQDVIRCSLCTDVVVHHCNSCAVNLCKRCVSRHIENSKASKHEILPYASQSVFSEPEEQKCKDHPKQISDLYCQDCNVSICSRCLTGNHKRHGAVDLAEIYETTRSTIKEDLQELRHFKHEYEKVVQKMEGKLAQYLTECDKEIDSLKEIGKTWHQIIDVTINTMKKNVTDMGDEDIKCLKDDIEEIQKSLQDIIDTIQKNEDLLKDDKTFDLLEYESRVDELRLVPNRIEISPPKVVPSDVKHEDIILQLMSLKPSIKSTLPGFSISRTGEVSAVSARMLLEEPDCLATLKIDCTKLKGIFCEFPDKAWVYGDDEKLSQFDKKGTLLKCIDAISGNSQKDIALNNENEIAFSHKTDECVNVVRNGHIEKLVNVAGWIPYGLCFNSEGDLMVCMRRNSYIESKVGIFSEGRMKQEIQFDDTGKPLFSSSRNNMYITENGNRDICVSDCNACAVIVVKKSGEFRFRYTGNHSRSYKEFYPHGIDTDNCCRILVVDRNNDCVHVIDRNGKFLRYINCTLRDPFVISVDSNENLWVGECDTECIKVIKYLD